MRWNHPREPKPCCWASTDHPYFSVRHDKLAGFLRIKARSTMGLGLGRPKLDRTLPIRAQTSDLPPVSLWFQVRDWYHCTKIHG